MKILTFNFRVWYRDLKKGEENWKNRRDKINKMIRKIDPDIILAQELLFPMTSCIPDSYKKAIPLSTSHHIYIRKSYKVLSRTWKIRYCNALVDTGKEKYNLFSVHTHWNEDIYKKTCSQIKNSRDHAYVNIAGGDWNNDADTIRPLLLPVFDLIVPTESTFQSWDTGKEGTIDFFAISARIPSKVTVLSDIQDDIKISDHKPVILEI